MASAESLEPGIATAARRRVEDFVSGVKGQAESLKRKSLEDIWTGTRDYVKENPGKTILTSLALGLVLGRFLRRG